MFFEANNENLVNKKNLWNSNFITFVNNLEYVSLCKLESLEIFFTYQLHFKAIVFPLFN